MRKRIKIQNEHILSCMKKVKIRSSFFAVLCSLLALFPTPKGELKDIAKPHLGFYECETVTLSGKDLSGEFSYIRLELKEEEVFLLHYAKKGGKEKTEKGVYHYNKEKQTITLSGAGFKREFPLKEGVIDVHIVFGTKNLMMKFKQK